MRFCLLLLVLLMLLLAPATGHAQSAAPAHPFAVKTQPAAAGEEGRRPAPAFRRSAPASQGQTQSTRRSWWSQFQKWIIDKQRDLHRQLTKGVRALKTGNPLTAILSLSFVSFIYGVVHAVGPGHGKAVITSYVFANERTLKRGIWLAVLSSLMQAVTAVTAVTILAVLLNATGFRIQAIAQHLETASYALVALIGLWLVISQTRKLFAFRAAGAATDHHTEHARDHHHHHDDPHHVHDEHCGCGHNHIPAADTLTGDDWSWKKGLSIILAVGMRPCTGAIIVLVFAFVNGLYWAGVASTFAMAVGTAITISSLAVLAVGSKQLALRLYGDNSRAAELTLSLVALAGGLFVLFLGATLFMSTMGPARPFG